MIEILLLFLNGSANFFLLLLNLVMDLVQLAIYASIIIKIILSFEK